MEAKPYHLYGISGAGSLVIEYLLEKGQIAYDITYVDEAQRNAKSFRDLSPRGQIPLLITPEGHGLTESIAITIYLLDRHPEIGLMPAENPERGKTLQWLSFLGVNLYTANQRYYQTHYFHGDQDVIQRKRFS